MSKPLPKSSQSAKNSVYVNYVMKTKVKGLDETEQIRRGKVLAQMLLLKPSREFSDRYITEWGTKTALGLFLSVKRIVEDGE
jgi:hypothetical protein